MAKKNNIPQVKNEEQYEAYETWATANKSRHE